MMTKEKWNNITGSKPFTIALSLLIALILWLYVTATEGVPVEIDFQNVKVQFKGAETLQETNGLFVTEWDHSTVDLRLSGLRRNLGKIRERDLSVEVDLSRVQSTGHYSMRYSINYPSGISAEDVTVVSCEPENIAVTVDRLMSKKVEVKGSFTGTVAEGFMADSELIFEPLTVRITGPKTLVDQVDCAWISITRENVDSTLQFDTSYELLDTEGKRIESSAITLEQDEVNVTLNVLMTKVVALKAALVDGGGATEKNAIVTVEPKSITLAGSAATLDAVNQIVVDTVKLSGVNSVYEIGNVVIPIPNDTVNLSGMNTASVRVEIQNLSTATYTVGASSVVFTNIPEGFQPECITESLPVLLRGSEEEIAAVKPGNIRVVCDLSVVNAASGIQNVPARITVDGSPNVGGVGDYKVYVRLSAG